MWIEIKTNTKRLKPAELDEAVEFNDNGSAQVDKETGEWLIENYKTITEKSEDN